MVDLFSNIWNWNIEPIPIIIALSIYFVPVVYRKYKSDVYTPLYFSVYPLARLNVPLSRYLGPSFVDDYIEDNDVDREKKILNIKSFFSTVLYVILIPFFLSITWTLFLTKEQFVISACAILVSIILRFTLSVINFKSYTRVSRQGLLSFFYSFVIIIFFYILIRVHYWIFPYFSSRDYGTIAKTFGDLIILDVVVSVLIVGVLVPIIVSIIFNRKAREATNEAFKSYEQTAASFDTEFKKGNQTKPTTGSNNCN